MCDFVRISVTFLDSRFHGRGDDEAPEWPPSPLRLVQAIVASNFDRIDNDGPLVEALRWLERRPPPRIVAPRCVFGAAYRLSVPNNAMDLVGKAWVAGNYFGTGDLNPASHRAMKTVRPTLMFEGDTVHYLWAMEESVPLELIESLIGAARRIVVLGWGIDLVVGDADYIDAAKMTSLRGERWSASTSSAQTSLRVPVTGTLEQLLSRHDAFIHRMGKKALVPAAPLSKFGKTGYRRSSDPVGRPHRVFELRETDGSWHRYPHRKLIHIAGMVRHLAIEAMQKDPPRGVAPDWVESFVAGHASGDSNGHRQLSYLPLPSIGHEHTDPGVRRVMIAAPVGDDAWLDHVARRLAGQVLKPEHGKPDPFDGDPPLLVPVKRDNVARLYTNPANVWHSFTPVILPGHDDKKTGKTRALIEKALRQSGIDQPCEFEWSAFSRFRKSFSAHKRSRDKQPQGYYRPDHLQTQTAVHLTIRFKDGLEVPGPIVIGAGRHCGLGLMANIRED